MNQAQSDYNQAENSYQMAFQAWSADQSDDNENALEIAEQMRSEAQITYQNAKTAYGDYKAQKPAAPVMSDFTGEADIVSDGTRRLKGFLIHIGHHKNLGGPVILDDHGDQSVGVQLKVFPRHRTFKGINCNTVLL